MSKLSPYPNQGVIIRHLASAFDLKAGNKQLDEYVKKGDSDWQLRSRLVDEVFVSPIGKSIDSETAAFFKLLIEDFLDDYLELVKTVGLDGVPRAVALKLLIVHYFSWQSSMFLFTLFKVIEGPSASCFIVPDRCAIDAVIEWFSENIEDWQKGHSLWPKEHKDRLVVWRKGAELPSYTSIMLLPTWFADSGVPLDGVMASKLRFFLLIARAVEWFKAQKTGIHGVNATAQHILYGHEHYDSAGALRYAQSEQNQKYQVLQKDGLRLNKLLSSDRHKLANEQQAIRTQLDQFKVLQLSIDPDKHTGYYLHWLEARWQLFAGHLKQSLSYYKKAFAQSLYCAGRSQLEIIEQAIVVAAKLKDRAFIKKLKNQAIVFGMFVEPPEDDGNSINNKRSRSNSSVAEDWEVDVWSASFSRMFPQGSMFSGVCSDEVIERIGPLILGDIDEIKPDYRYPDKNIKIGKTWKKTTPQLVFFSEINKSDVVAKLLNKGASVDVCSDAGDTPILMAVQELNKLIMPIASLDDTCFKLISAIPHDPKTINLRTSKKRLLPLVCAVESGQPEVIKTLLAMGADVDRRGETDGQTALHHCISTIASLNDLPKFRERYRKGSKRPTKALLEGRRRNNAFMSGITINHQLSAWVSTENNEECQLIESTILDFYIERLGLLSLENMREIANILLDAGASPEAEHDSAIKGYTPLMLAAEFDEAMLFSKMLELGGSPFKTYKCPQTHQDVDCWKIAEFFGSSEVLTILRENIDQPLS